MHYIALLRGINVGGNRKVEMKKLKALLESLGYRNVTTYLNSGNVIFETEYSRDQLQEEIPKALEEEFGFEITTLIRSKEEMRHIAQAIPPQWQNNAEQKTDVAYLFPEIDSEKTVDEIPFKREYVEIIYVKGAIIWHLMKKDYNKSRINKLIGRKLYQQMTVRNVNTARRLAFDSKAV